MICGCGPVRRHGGRIVDERIVGRRRERDAGGRGSEHAGEEPPATESPPDAAPAEGAEHAGEEPPVTESPPDAALVEEERAPGWYPDPDGSGWRRYWDGTAWTSASAEQLAAAAGKTPRARGEAPAPGRRNIAGVLVAFVVLAAIVAVIVAVTGSGGHPGHAAASVTASSATRATTTGAPTTTVTTGAPAPLTAAQITRAVNAYVAAYNTRSIAALGALLSPSLVRRAGGGPPQNLATALALYRGQFAVEPNPDLVLANVRVAPGVGQGSAGARFGVYAHGRRTRGKIAFHFTASGPRLLIDQLNIHAR